MWLLRPTWLVGEYAWPFGVVRLSRSGDAMLMVRTNGGANGDANDDANENVREEAADEATVNSIRRGAREGLMLPGDEGSRVLRLGDTHSLRTTNGLATLAMCKMCAASSWADTLGLEAF